MTKRISKLANSLKQLGEIQVPEWDFITLLDTDIKELEITRSLRRLGNIHVMDWDFRTVLPAMKKIAYHEVDIIGLVKRAAHYKVMEWDFRSALGVDSKTAAKGAAGVLGHAEMQALVARLEGFLQYVVENLIDEPKHARITVTEIEPNGLRLKVVLVKRDVAMLISRKGSTAAAIRGILKSVAKAAGVWVLLDILSHEEEMALAAREKITDRG